MNTKEGRFVQDAAQVFDGISRSGVSIQVLVDCILKYYRVNFLSMTQRQKLQVFDFIRKHINSATLLLTGNSVSGIAICEVGRGEILSEIIS